MEIRLLVNTKIGKRFVLAGSIVDVDDELAKAAIKNNVAEALDDGGFEEFEGTETQQNGEFEGTETQQNGEFEGTETQQDEELKSYTIDDILPEELEPEPEPKPKKGKK